jgi:hypothetical protein
MASGATPSGLTPKERAVWQRYGVRLRRAERDLREARECLNKIGGDAGATPLWLMDSLDAVVAAITANAHLARGIELLRQRALSARSATNEVSA